MTLCTQQGWSPPPSGAELRALGQIRVGSELQGQLSLTTLPLKSHPEPILAWYKGPLQTLSSILIQEIKHRCFFHQSPISGLKHNLPGTLPPTQTGDIPPHPAVTSSISLSL